MTIVERIEAWLFGSAFPFWCSVGVDRNGPGFVEHLTLEGRPADVGFKRVRVQARQVYAFCQAAELGWTGSGLSAAERGVDLLIGKAWLGREHGWATTLTRGGDVLDPTADLYDIAFVLFALGWWFRVTQDKRVVPLALETLDFIDAHLRDPTGKGYWHRSGGALPHQQNPHMHLTEAMIVLRDATGHARFAAEADRLVGLCLTCFHDRGSRTLAEFFDAGWARQPGPGGVVLEPGHHYEWVWLLDRYIGAAADPRAPERQAMRDLFGFAVEHGQGPSGLVRDGVLADGTVVGPNYRLWPQAERLKAWLAMSERDGVDARAAVDTGVSQIFSHYLDPAPEGTWIEHRDADLMPIIDKIPSSSFYHVVLAFAEVLRFRSLFDQHAS